MQKGNSLLKKNPEYYIDIRQLYDWHQFNRSAATSQRNYFAARSDRYSNWYWTYIKVFKNHLRTTSRHFFFSACRACFCAQFIVDLLLYVVSCVQDIRSVSTMTVTSVSTTWILTTIIIIVHLCCSLNSPIYSMVNALCIHRTIILVSFSLIFFVFCPLNSTHFHRPKWKEPMQKLCFFFNCFLCIDRRFFSVLVFLCVFLCIYLKYIDLFSFIPSFCLFFFVSCV